MTSMIFDSGAGNLKVTSNEKGTADVTLSMGGGTITAPWSVFRDLVIPALRAHGLTVTRDDTL